MRRIIAAALGAALFTASASTLPAAGPTPAAGPSFDCRKAAAPDEKAVCADPQLSRLDRVVAEAYTDFTPEYGDKRRIGRQLAEARRACGADAACIAFAQIDALQTYGEVPDWISSYFGELLDREVVALRGAAKGAEQPLPAQVGQCAATHIAELQTRFGDPLAGADPMDGSVVVMTNGASGVSYGREEALAGSVVGQPVVTCLVSIPRDCPEEDERGRIYRTLNLATGGAWELADAQHMCGGA